MRYLCGRGIGGYSLTVYQDVDEDVEEDIREVEQRDTDAMFVCPYTRTKMEVPMKK